MRDLRRYASPVIVQNAGQVNIASDGGQQVNVQKSKQSKGRAKKRSGSKTNGKRASKAKPKQLAAKSAKESIRMEPITDSVPVVEALGKAILARLARLNVEGFDDNAVA
jgi:hypothetical protein